MGLYDEEDYEGSDNTSESVGKAIANISKKPLKDKDQKKGISGKGSEIPEWLKQVLIYVIAIILVAMIGYVVYLGVRPNYLNAKLDPNPSYITEGSSTTKLNVEVKNINKYDLKSLELTVNPVDKLSIAVIPSDTRKIPILGQDEKRIFSYDVSTIGTINPGDYILVVTLKLPEKTIEKKITWEIKSRK